MDVNSCKDQMQKAYLSGTAVHKPIPSEDVPQNWFSYEFRGIDFGHGGQEFWHTWWPRGPAHSN